MTNYKNYIELHEHPTGDTRRIEMLSDVLKSGTFLPNTVEYRDIDEEFIKWVSDELVIVSDDGIEFPTMNLFSNQRFSEYTQSWKFTDSNKNLLLNFKTVTRDNNPQYGKMHNGYWNIPGDDRFYLMKRQLVLDDNGTESLLDLKMKQPTTVDLNYKLSVFTTQYHSINDFNTLINKKFSSRQCYISPNGHFMPMTLESISDESSYSIDDRQFYGQTFTLTVMGYLITKEDYRVEEIPYKHGVTYPVMRTIKNKPSVEIEECNDDNGKVILTVYYPEKCSDNSASFTMDSDVDIEKINIVNLRNGYEIYVNGETTDKNGKIRLSDGDSVKIRAIKQIKNEEAEMILTGRMAN